MGVTDLSWGFNGNVLLASSTDGKILAIHFKPGLLGTLFLELDENAWKIQTNDKYIFVGRV